MSHKPYTPNFPESQDSPRAELLAAGKPNESYSMTLQSGYPGPPQYGPMPGAQPLPPAMPMQPGYQPGFQTGYQPGFQPGLSPGYQPQPEYPHMQGGFQPGYAPGAPIVHQPGMQPQGPPGRITDIVTVMSIYFFMIGSLNTGL